MGKSKNQFSEVVKTCKKVYENNFAKNNTMKLNIETSQGTIPIKAVHDKYDLIETVDGRFVRMYKLEDNNYSTETEEEQNTIFLGWKKLYNSFGNDTFLQLIINNKFIDQQDFIEQVSIKEANDKYDYLRKEMNEITYKRVSDGKNGIQKEKYLVVSIAAKNAKVANDIFNRLDKSINDTLTSIHSATKPLTVEDEIEILYEIYNDSSDKIVHKERVIEKDGRVTETKIFDYNNMRSMGLEIGDILAPSSFAISKDKIALGNKFARVLKVSGLPSHIADEALTKLTDAPFNYLTSFSIEPVSPEKAEKIVNTNYNLVMAEKSRLMKMEQQKADFSGALLPPSLLEREEEILELRRRMREEDEKLFKTSLTIVIFADNENDLKKNTDTLITEYKKHSFTVNVFINQQEEGFNSSLPFGFSQIIERRTLTSTSSAIFIPFSTLEINDTNGINYSCNLLSKNLICYDRLSASNFNGFILGTPGSGKSFSAKIEMLNVFLRTNSDIIVIDPEDEYTALAHELDGETIRIIPGGDIHINPLEIVDEYEFDEEDTNSINAKADFILKLMECILNSPFGINSVQQTIIDECVHSLYQPFISKGRLRDIPSEKMPTLSDLQVLLGQRREPEARELSMALKLYTGKGSLNTFGFRTNVHINNRFTVYQIKDVGDRLKPIAMLTILDHVWNKIVENRKLGKNTWFYVDEIYLLFQQEYSASFLNQLFRRARKYGGIPTGITQNVSPLLESPTARDMLQNCQFIEILAQAGPDRERLKEILNLSDQLVSYITSSPRGQGLLYTGRNTIPFYSQFPKSSEVYKVLTSDMKEIKAFEEEERRNKLRKNKEEREIA